MGKGYIEIVPELLIELLGLPDGVTVCGADWNFPSDCTRLYLIHDSIPDRRGRTLERLGIMYDKSDKAHLAWIGDLS